MKFKELIATAKVVEESFQNTESRNNVIEELLLCYPSTYLTTLYDDELAFLYVSQVVEYNKTKTTVRQLKTELAMAYGAGITSLICACRKAKLKLGKAYHQVINSILDEDLKNAILSIDK